jgi:deazaflavin-dependent oxidoreductase (nitroreductase family)
MGIDKRRMTRVGNRIGVWMYRTLDGRMASGSKNVHVLMITTPGRRTGIPRSTCVRYLDVDGGYLVWGTGSGSPRDPDWFCNLRAAETADVQIRSTRIRARPKELTGEQRNVMWTEVVLAQAPEVTKYAHRAGRTIPIAILEPT